MLMIVMLYILLWWAFANLTFHNIEFDLQSGSAINTFLFDQCQPIRRYWFISWLGKIFRINNSIIYRSGRWIFQVFLYGKWNVYQHVLDITFQHWIGVFLRLVGCVISILRIFDVMYGFRIDTAVVTTLCSRGHFVFYSLDTTKRKLM